ncbi:MAG TPA: hypothetical protein VH599_03390, partial [Ktedonobacterales bacterium]
PAAAAGNGPDPADALCALRAARAVCYAGRHARLPRLLGRSVPRADPPHLKRSQMAQRATCSAAFQAANDSPAPACALQANGSVGQRPAARMAALQVACALQANGSVGQR